MISLQIAIIDDCQRDRDLVRDMTARYLQEHQIQGDIQCFPSSESFLKDSHPEQFSILLLDLYMDGMDGMSLAQIIRQQGIPSQLVFVTSSDAYAVRSYDVEASDYLLKPVSAPALERALNRCMARIQVVPKYIEVISNRLPIQIPLHSILWINTYQNAILFHTDANEVKTYMTFEAITQMLSGEKRFLMCYKGCMVNMDRIAAIEGDDFRMENGDLVQIRKRGGNQIKHTYIQYLCDRTSDHP